jgi:hypothetical protein
MFTGDIVEYHSACYCGDGHFNDWPTTLDMIREVRSEAIAPGRGDALVGKRDGQCGAREYDATSSSTYRPVARVVARGGSLKEAWDACRAECDPKFKDYAIYEHCLPFNVAAPMTRRGIDTPRIWTAERDARCGRSCRAEPGGRRCPPVTSAATLLVPSGMTVHHRRGIFAG